MERFYVSATLVVVYLFPSLAPPSPTNSHQEIFIWEEILLLTLEWPLALVFHVTSFFFLKEEWPTSNASGASPKPSLTPHRLTSTLTTNKTSFFSINKLGSCLLNLPEMSWSLLLLRLPAYFPHWAHPDLLLVFQAGQYQLISRSSCLRKGLWLASALSCTSEGPLHVDNSSEMEKIATVRGMAIYLSFKLELHVHLKGMI